MAKLIEEKGALNPRERGREGLDWIVTGGERNKKVEQQADGITVIHQSHPSFIDRTNDWVE